MKNRIIALISLFLIISTSLSAQFKTTWKTDNPGSSNDNQITIPTTTGTYLYDITWEEVGNPANNGTEPIGQTGNYTITFPSAGIYQVTITGTFPRIYFNGAGFPSDDTDHDKILTIEQWGTNPWTSMANAFSGCKNLQINATDSPNLSGVTDLTYMFRECEVLDANINSWDVSTINTMIGVFREASAFNQLLNTWDVSNVTSMKELFFFASSFNQDIGGWHTTSVTDMSSMFGGATIFNQNINTIAVTGAWTVSNVTDMSGMFAGTEDFDQPIGNWNVSNVNTMSSMFSSAHAFNGDISSWNISNVTNLSGMFKDATAFNQIISGWNVSNVTDMSELFAGTTFNPNISSWVVSSVNSFHSMFLNNTGFNQNISGWMLNTVSFIDMRLMFDGATAFDQNIGGWDMSRVNNLHRMLSNSGLSVDNYDNLLIGWAGQSLSANESLGAEGLFYCAGKNARDILTNASNNWFITDEGLGCISVFEGANISGPQIINAQAKVIDFGSIDIAPSSKTLSFTIENQTSSDLSSFTASITGTAFSISIVPPSTINAGFPETIEVELSSITAAGPFTETVTFSYVTYTASTEQFTFTITGEVTTNTEPEIKAFEGNTTAGTELINGVTFLVGEADRDMPAITNQLTIENKGSSDLIINGITLPGSVFSFTAPSTIPISIPINTSQTIDLSVDASTGGSFSEVLTITSNDADEPSFEITLNATIYGPEIIVIDGNDVFSDPQINNGQAAPIEFGSVLEGTDIIRQFTFSNYGPVDLTLYSIDVAAPFLITSSLPPPIPGIVDGIPSTSAMTITLDGATAGNFNEIITITSDDDLTPSFTFSVTGTIIDPNAPKIYWSETTGNQINRSNNDGNLFEQFSTTNGPPQGIAYDNINGLIYWSDQLGDIWQGTIDATGILNPIKIIDDGTDLSRKINGISLDLANGFIYWASNYDLSIKRADLNAAIPNATVQTVVSGLDGIDNSGGEVNSIAVDPAAGKVYYTYTDYTPNISDPSTTYLASANTDGSNIQVLTFTDFQYFQNDSYFDVKISPSTNRIYWSGFGDNIGAEIFQADLSPFANITSFSADGPAKGISIDTTNGKIYWVDDNLPSLKPAEIKRANLDGSNIEILLSGSPNVFTPQFISIDNEVVSSCSNPPTVSAGGDQTICAGSTVSLVATQGGTPTTILWNTGGNGTFSSKTSLSTIYTPTADDILAGSITIGIMADDPDGSGPCTAATDQVVITFVALPTVNAGTDQTVCGTGPIGLIGSFGGGATSTLWSSALGDGDFSDTADPLATYEPGLNDMLTGSVTLIITSVNPSSCTPVFDDVILTFSPISVDAGADQTICANSTATILATLTYATAGIWSSDGNGTFDNANNLNAIYTPNATDAGNIITLSFTVPDPDGSGSCIETADQLLLSVDLLDVVDAGVDQTICETGTVSLSATINDVTTPVFWVSSGDGNFDLATSLTPIYSLGTTDIANGSVILTISSGTPSGKGVCPTASDALTVTLAPAHTADAGADQTICLSDVITLTGVVGGGASTGTWISDGDGTFDDITALNTNYNLGSGDSSSGTVILTLSTDATNCGSVSDQLEITIKLPITVIDQPASLKVSEIVIIDVFNGAILNTGDIITTTILSQPTKGTATVNNDGTISYTALTGNVGDDSFVFQIENQCNQTASASALLSIENAPPAFDDGNATAIPGSPVVISITDLITDLNGNIDLSSITIIQQPGSGAPATLDADNNLIVDYTGIVFFGTDEVVIEVCDFGGACTEASIFIVVEALPIKAFNAVSPNGDGRHDFLEFQYIEAYPNNEIKIFNRWGDIVFEATGYNNNDVIFSGVSNKGGNNELPTGTYYYSVYLIDTDETVNGYFELRR